MPLAMHNLSPDCYLAPPYRWRSQKTRKVTVMKKLGLRLRLHYLS